VEHSLARNLDDVVRKALGHAAPTPALVVSDRQSALARLLADGYRAALPHAAFVDFDAATVPDVMAAVSALPPGSLVVLVQSTRFEMGDFRFRLELFRRGLHVIEHPHVGRLPDDEVGVYVDALAYDPAYYRGLGAALKARIDGAGAIIVVSAAGVLTYGGPFEDAKLNVGDYTGFTNVGGQFPIGEVFTEPVDLEAVNGTVGIAAFGAGDFSVTFMDVPFGIVIERGRVVAAPDAPPAFHAILREIAAEEGQVWVRELGFGINRAMTATRRVTDVSTYERMCGVHMSLGAKHAVYPKAGFSKRKTRFHVDVFCAAERVEVDGAVVFAGGGWIW
jgi:aminopeptidase